MEDEMTVSVGSALEAIPSVSARSTILSPEVQDAGRNAVFSALVKGDEDITGLVAYSIFKQNELDWLADFRNAKQREPTADEAEAYILGESTMRRLATYRHLADATLQGKGPDIASGGAAGRSLALRPQGGIAGKGGAKDALSLPTLGYIALGLIILIAVYFVARSGQPR